MIRPAMEALEQVLRAYDAQQRKHGPSEGSIHRPEASDLRRLRVLVEEIGEVAEAMDSRHVERIARQHDLATGDAELYALDHVAQEVAQVAASAMAWLTAYAWSASRATGGRWDADPSVEGDRYTVIDWGDAGQLTYWADESVHNERGGPMLTVTGVPAT